GRRARGRVTMLLDCDAPATLGYALACSVAWHTRASTLLVLIADGEPAADLTALAGPLSDGVPSLHPHRTGHAPGDSAHSPTRAELLFTTPTGAFAPPILGSTLEELATSYDHVLVQVSG